MCFQQRESLAKLTKFGIFENEFQLIANGMKIGAIDLFCTIANHSEHSWDFFVPGQRGNNSPFFYSYPFSEFYCINCGNVFNS